MNKKGQVYYLIGDKALVPYAPSPYICYSNVNSAVNVSCLFEISNFSIKKLIYISLFIKKKILDSHFL